MGGRGVGRPLATRYLQTHPAVLCVSELLYEEAHSLGLSLGLAARGHFGAVALQREEGLLQWRHKGLGLQTWPQGRRCHPHLRVGQHVGVRAIEQEEAIVRGAGALLCLQL